MKTHDFTRPGWGWAIGSWIPVDREGLVVRALGHGRGLEHGDFIILSSGGGQTTRYQISKVDYFRDPSDMWNAVLKFAPRTQSGET